jgi:hypothetical protein
VCIPHAYMCVCLCASLMLRGAVKSVKVGLKFSMFVLKVLLE